MILNSGRLQLIYVELSLRAVLNNIVVMSWKQSYVVYWKQPFAIILLKWYQYLWRIHEHDAVHRRSPLSLHSQPFVACILLARSIGRFCNAHREIISRSRVMKDTVTRRLSTG